MSEQTVKAGIALTNGRMQFETTGKDLPPVVLDSYPPFGEGEGYSPLHLLLVSLMSCTAMGVLSLLRDRMRRTVTDARVEASGTLRDEHPKAFSHIAMKLTIISPDATEAEVQRALDSAEKKICPVWAMLKGNVEITTQIEVIG